MKAKLFYPSPRVPRPTNTRGVRVLLPLLLITLALILVGSSANAHGIGYYQIRGAQIDPYTVHVWVAPGMLRTGDVHIDTAVFDENGAPAEGILVRVSFIPLDNDAQPLVSMAGAPDLEYPHARGATFRLETPGMYRLEIAISTPEGEAGVTSADVEVMTVGWHIKTAIASIFLASAASGAWMVYQTRAFWISGAVARQARLRNLRIRKLDRGSYLTGGFVYMSSSEGTGQQSRTARLMQRLNGMYHAPALWFYMLVIVAHWLEHVLQIYQIYGLGWAPEKAGGILGVIYPQLIESETLHFVYDFIQWAGIIILAPGFRGPRARLFWNIAMVVQTWHYIEHVLLMGQYLTGYYLFGAPHQISVLQLWFPRAELHFAYNLLVFVPMVIAVHYYLQPRLAMLAAMQAAENEEGS
jgi:hypothetical protein